MLSRLTITARVWSGSSVKAMSSFAPLLPLNNMQPIKEAFPKKKRWGRGPGSDRGKLCGHGHQKSYAHGIAFEGGQAPIYKTRPKVGFNNHTRKDLAVVNIGQIQEWIDRGRLVPKKDDFITIRDLMVCGIVKDAREGVKLLGKGKELAKTPIHLEVSYASSEAIRTIEALGGTVTCVHLNKLALRALIKPYKFELLPRRARPPPKIINHYLDRTKNGYLSPEIQIRNLKMFGTVTSEKKYRAEHDRFMEAKRAAGDIRYKVGAYGPKPMLNAME